MAFSIKDEETDRLARRYAKLRGTSITRAVRDALARQLSKGGGKPARRKKARHAEIMKLLKKIHAAPTLDPRTPDEIMGFNEHGVFDLIVVDSSALIAVLLEEPGWKALLACMEEAGGFLISGVNYVETAVVHESRRGIAHCDKYDQLLAYLDADITEINPEQAKIAREAYRRYGKGRHPAGLNICDCFAYALAKNYDAPLLFKGDDFAKTDIVSAL